MEKGLSLTKSFVIPGSKEAFMGKPENVHRKPEETRLGKLRKSRDAAWGSTNKLAGALTPFQCIDRVP